MVVYLVFEMFCIIYVLMCKVLFKEGVFYVQLMQVLSYVVWRDECCFGIEFDVGCGC